MSRSNTRCGASSRKTLTRLLVVLALVLLIRKWVCVPALVLGASMSPTLRDRQVVLVNKLAYLFRPPARGDIVSIWTGREWLIKRIIGLPGEEVALKKGTLLVNGKLVPEPYLEASGDVELAPGKIPVNSFGVIGDNRPGTAVALVNRSRIVGAIVGRHKIFEEKASNPQEGKELAGPPSSRPGVGTTRVWEMQWVCKGTDRLSITHPRPVSSQPGAQPASSRWRRSDTNRNGKSRNL